MVLALLIFTGTKHWLKSKGYYRAGIGSKEKTPPQGWFWLKSQDPTTGLTQRVPIWLKNSGWGHQSAPSKFCYFIRIVKKGALEQPLWVILTGILYDWVKSNMTQVKYHAVFWNPLITLDHICVVWQFATFLKISSFWEFLICRKTQGKRDSALDVPN